MCVRARWYLNTTPRPTRAQIGAAAHRLAAASLKVRDRRCVFSPAAAFCWRPNRKQSAASCYVNCEKLLQKQQKPAETRRVKRRRWGKGCGRPDFLSLPGEVQDAAGWRDNQSLSFLDGSQDFYFEKSWTGRLPHRQNKLKEDKEGFKSQVRIENKCLLSSWNFNLKRRDGGSVQQGNF